MRKYRLSVADVAEMLGLNLEYIRQMKAGVTPVTQRNIRLIELEMVQRNNEKKVAL
jgi:hypothetical protein